MYTQLFLLTTVFKNILCVKTLVNLGPLVLVLFFPFVLMLNSDFSHFCKGKLLSLDQTKMQVKASSGCELKILPGLQIFIFLLAENNVSI